MAKLYAHHDQSGKVHSLVSFEGPEGSGMSLVAKPGHLVSEVEAPTLKRGPEGLEQLRALAKGAHLEGSTEPKRLKRGSS